VDGEPDREWVEVRALGHLQTTSRLPDALRLEVAQDGVAIPDIEDEEAAGGEARAPARDDGAVVVIAEEAERVIPCRAAVL
jgi:hypothetical protein